jgi:predicted methyltransferase
MFIRNDSPNRSVRHFVFVLRRPSYSRIQALKRLANSSSCYFMIFSSEKSPNGFVHIQSFVIMNRNFTVEQLLRLFPFSTSIRVAQSNPYKNIAYVMKSGVYWQNKRYNFPQSEKEYY